MKIKVKVIAGSSEEKVEYLEDQALYKVKVTKVPEKGRANEAVVELLAKNLNLNTKNVQLVSGITSNIKIFEIKKTNFSINLSDYSMVFMFIFLARKMLKMSVKLVI